MGANNQLVKENGNKILTINCNQTAQMTALCQTKTTNTLHHTQEFGVSP